MHAGRDRRRPVICRYRSADWSNPSIAAALDATNLARLATDGREPLLWLAIVAANADGTATANLRAPVVINPGTMRGIQVITPESAYPVDHPLQVG